jgi:glutaredoxin
MKSAPQTAQTDRPRVVLYTRDGCHLCEEALRVLEAHGVTPECIDIDAIPELRERFDTCVPVVAVDGKIRFRGRVEAVLLRRLLGLQS